MPEALYELLTLSEARERYGLQHHQLYAAAARGELHRVQRRQQGRVYYLDWELSALATRINIRFRAAA